MRSQIDHAGSPINTAIWEIPDLEDIGTDHGPKLEMTGKVVFVTVQGMGEARTIAAEYIQAGANVALLDVAEWALHILQPQLQELADSGQPIHCNSWVTAVEEVIGRFGPIDLWLDTRAMMWPAVSRIGEF